MKCEMCKYKADMADVSDQSETGADALCTRACFYSLVNHDDDCHFLPQKRKLRCGDCAHYGYDLGCAGMEEDEEPYFYGELCGGYIDAKEEEFREFLAFWMVQGIYDRSRLEEIMDEVEEFYADIENQCSDKP